VSDKTALSSPCRLFLRNLGAHRFYAGKVCTGVIMLLTIGGLGIWAMIDFVDCFSVSLRCAAQDYPV